MAEETSVITKAKTRKPSAPIKWHGGKTYLAAAIVEMMPVHVHYVEPFFGGGAVFFRKPDELIEGHSEVINDVYAELVNFWRVLQTAEHFEAFQREVFATPFAKPVWEASLSGKHQDPVRQAVAFFVRYRQSRQGIGRDFATMSRNRTRRGMNEQVASWLSAIEGLPAAHERLSRVAIFCDDACQLIRREDGSNTFHYCDPPYLPQTRVTNDTYAFEMGTEQHEELLETLGSIEGTMLLSGYRNELYDAAAKRYGWKRRDIKIDNKASSQKTKPIKVESIWSNF
ncbi:MAG: DNA adenine methylase [Aureliella sp.]